LFTWNIPVCVEKHLCKLKWTRVWGAQERTPSIENAVKSV